MEPVFAGIIAAVFGIEPAPTALVYASGAFILIGCAMASVEPAVLEKACRRCAFVVCQKLFAARRRSMSWGLPTEVASPLYGAAATGCTTYGLVPSHSDEGDVELQLVVTTTPSSNRGAIPGTSKRVVAPEGGGVLYGTSEEGALLGAIAEAKKRAAYT